MGVFIVTYMFMTKVFIDVMKFLSYDPNLDTGCVHFHEFSPKRNITIHLVTDAASIRNFLLLKILHPK